MPDPELLWKQYELQTDLYKFYLELILDVNVFYYAITGGLLSFYFSQAEARRLRLSLLLPAVMSLGLAGVFLYGADLQSTRCSMETIATSLGLGTWPEIRVLQVALLVFAGIFVLTAAAMFFLILRRRGPLPAEAPGE